MLKGVLQHCKAILKPNRRDPALLFFVTSAYLHHCIYSYSTYSIHLNIPHHSLQMCFLSLSAIPSFQLTFNNKSVKSYSFNASITFYSIFFFWELKGKGLGVRNKAGMVLGVFLGPEVVSIGSDKFTSKTSFLTSVYHKKTKGVLRSVIGHEFFSRAYGIYKLFLVIFSLFSVFFFCTFSSVYFSLYVFCTKEY